MIFSWMTGRVNGESRYIHWFIMPKQHIHYCRARDCWSVCKEHVRRTDNVHQHWYILKSNPSTDCIPGWIFSCQLLSLWPRCRILWRSFRPRWYLQTERLQNHCTRLHRRPPLCNGCGYVYDLLHKILLRHEMPESSENTGRHLHSRSVRRWGNAIVFDRINKHQALNRPHCTSCDANVSASLSCSISHNAHTYRQ